MSYTMFDKVFDELMDAIEERDIHDAYPRLGSGTDAENAKTLGARVSELWDLSEFLEGNADYAGRDARDPAEIELVMAAFSAHQRVAVG